MHQAEAGISQSRLELRLCGDPDPRWPSSPADDPDRRVQPQVPCHPVARRINAIGVIETLADAMLMNGIPTNIRSDNGPEMVAKVLREWLTTLAPVTFILNPDSFGRMATVSPSMASFGTNCSTEKSSTASRRQRWSLNNGATTTTPNNRTPPSVTDHRHPSQSRPNPSPSTRRQTCNSLSLRLVQNIRQAS